MQPDDQQSYQAPQASPDQANPPVDDVVPESNQAVEAASSEGEQSQQAPAPKEGPADSEPIRWQASEYVHNEKDHLWFILFALATIALTGVAIFLIKSFTFALLVPIMAAALFLYTRRPPRILDYTLSRHGLYINDELFPFSEFKGFALVHGLEQYSIMLIPTKRFKPAISINFPEEAGEAIIDTLAPRLPMREMQPDAIDRIVRKLHL